MENSSFLPKGKVSYLFCHLMIFYGFTSHVCLQRLLSNSLSHGLSIFQEGKSDGKDSLKLEAQVGKSKVCC